MRTQELSLRAYDRVDAAANCLNPQTFFWQVRLVIFGKFRYFETTLWFILLLLFLFLAR